MMATRKQVIEVAGRRCRELRDSGKMYEPYGTHHLRGDIKKAGLEQPENWIDWRNWLESLRLKAFWNRLHQEGCMIAGIRKPRINQTRAYNQFVRDYAAEGRRSSQ